MRLDLQLLAAALLLSASGIPWPVGADNITQALSSHGEYSVFQAFLVKTKVSYEIDSRSSITVLAPSDAILLPVVQQHGVGVLADILRFHVLLQFFDTQELHSAANSTVTTLYQSTGRAQGDAGIVDLSLQPDGSIGIARRGQVQKTARIQRQLYSNPYNLSVFDVSAVLLPDGLPQADVAANITDVLIRAGGFSTFAALLAATGLGDEVQSKAVSGLTLLLPNDAVFARTFTQEQMDRLSSAQKATLVKAHALPSYDPWEYLSLVAPNTLLATLATSPSQADYLLSVSPSDGKLYLGTGIVTAGVDSRPVYQNYPVAIFSVDKVLLPREIFAAFPPAPASAPDTASSSPPTSSAPPTTTFVPTPSSPSPSSPAPVPALPDTSPVPAPPTPRLAPSPTLPPSPSSGAPPPSPGRSPTPAPRSAAAGPHSAGGPTEAQVGQNAASPAAHFSLAAVVLVSALAIFL